MDQTVSSGMPTHEALALLPLPATLSDPQRDGHICVYGGEAITTLTSVDLGSRTHEGRRIFPRACRPCVGRAAMGALFDHASGPDACQDCKTSPECATGLAFNRIIRQAC